MKSKSILIILVFISIAIKLVISEFIAPHDEEIKRQWNVFKSKHNIRMGRIEDRKIFINFKNNYLRVAQHNYKYYQNDTDFLTEVNELSLLSHEEYSKTKLGAFGDLNAYLAHIANHNNSEEAHLREQNSHDNSTITISTSGRLLSQSRSVDWVAQGKVSYVKNQLTCGSCWSFAAASVIESLYAMKFGVLKDFSEQNLIDCDSNKPGRGTSLMNYGCTGGWPEAAFDYIKYNGIVEDMYYPYRNRQGSCDQSKIAGHPKVRISGWSNVGYGDELGLANAVAQAGPVAIGVDASEWEFAHYSGGIYSSNGCSAQNVNHAVVVVGYGTENGKDFWLIKNSWGGAWGINGYMKLARNRGNMCGVATVATYAY